MKIPKLVPVAVSVISVGCGALAVAIILRDGRVMALKSTYKNISQFMREDDMAIHKNQTKFLFDAVTGKKIECQMSNPDIVAD